MTSFRSAAIVLALAIALAAAAFAQTPSRRPKPASPATPPAAAPAAPAVAPAGPAPGGADAGSDSQTLDRVAAEVNGDVVLESEVWEQVQSILSRSQSRPDSAELDTLRRQVLDNLINLKLVYGEAKKAGITISDAELDKMVDQEIQNKTQEVGGEEALAEALRRENLTIDRLRDNYREQLRMQEISSRYQQKQVARPRVTASEAEAFFKEHPDRFPKKAAEYRLAVLQIQVTADSATDAAARAKVVAARKRILGGEKFAKVAQELSEDTGTARSGGDLGYFVRGTTVPEFEKVAFTQKIGTVSEPVRTPFGWHLIEVMERDTLKTRTRRDSLDAQGHPLEEAHARHLLIRVDPTQKDADRAEGLITSLRDRAVRGEDFGALAKRYSRYAGPHSDDGEIGWVPVDQLSANIRAALDTTAVGAITQPVVSPGQVTGVSFNLFKVLEKRPARAYTLDEVKDQLPDVVGRMKYNDKVDEWLKGLRAKASIDIKKL